ncbi:MAG: prepilin-type N-terminal cleavage/methylation domain-containing protein [Bacteroidia bacterium]|jgi:prepilin-type N-terminal cleavage/methylation domain-containing protein
MHPQPTLRRAGFTLLELIGVMAVIAILSAALLPGAIDMIRVQRAVNDRAELPKIAEALKRGMLREQVFPIYENGANVSTDGNVAYWWNLAARHGGGSASAVRYPLGIRPGSTTTRKLYFAEANWGGQSFFEVTGDGIAWLAAPLDPKELRLLLVSTTNPDLSLPDVLTITQFNAFWNNWAIGNNGDPATGNWPNYGLSTVQWAGRAPELNIERIDLRDWLCTVVIENRRAIAEASGAEFTEASPSYSGTSLMDDWELDSVYAYTENLIDTEIVLRCAEVTDESGDTYTQVSGLDLAKRGRVIDESNDVLIQISGFKIVTSGTPPTNNSTRATGEFELSLTDRAPLALLFSPSTDSPLVLSGWDNADVPIQNRYFLKTQELLLGEPWTFAEVGIFTITDNFSTLRFDGLQWHY